MPPLPLRERAGRPGISSAPVRVRGTKKISKSILAVFGLLVLAAWAPKPAHLHIKSVGVIAALGDTCMFVHVRDTPFQWIGPPEAGFLEISDWGLDDEVAKLVETALGPRYNVQSIPIEHQDFDTWSYASLTRRVRELPVPVTPVDAYLLVLRDWHPDAIGGSDHHLVGLGLYRNDLVHGRGRYGEFAAYRLVLMEPDRGKVLASVPGILLTAEFPTLPAKPTLWPRTQNDLTDRQRETLRENFLSLMVNSLPVTLEWLGLATP